MKEVVEFMKRYSFQEGYYDCKSKTLVFYADGPDPISRPRRGKISQEWFNLELLLFSRKKDLVFENRSCLLKLTH